MGSWFLFQNRWNHQPLIAVVLVFLGVVTSNKRPHQLTVKKRFSPNCTLSVWFLPQTIAMNVHVRPCNVFHHYTKVIKLCHKKHESTILLLNSTSALLNSMSHCMFSVVAYDIFTFTCVLNVHVCDCKHNETCFPRTALHYPKNTGGLTVQGT